MVDGGEPGVDSRDEGKHTGSIHVFYTNDELYRVGQKNRTVFRLDNFVTVSPRKACCMSKFSQFYREKGTKLAFQ